MRQAGGELTFVVFLRLDGPTKKYLRINAPSRASNSPPQLRHSTVSTDGSICAISTDTTLYAIPQCGQLNKDCGGFNMAWIIVSAAWQLWDKPSK